MEGIFRKSGNFSRQKELQKHISLGQTCDKIDDKYGLFECCDVLKKFVRELPQPLLTDALRPLFLQTLSLPDENRRLEAIRLLLLMLPSVNRNLFYDLMCLFVKVIENSSQNKMNAFNLSVMFSQHFLHQRNSSAQDQVTKIDELTKCVQYMIEQGLSIFEPPQQLLKDATTWLQMREQTKMKSSMQGANMMSSTCLSLLPCPKLCATSTIQYDPQEYTKRQVGHC